MFRIREVCDAGRRVRVLFASFHTFADATSGASLCARELLAALSRRGASCEVVCGPKLDDARPLDQHFAKLRVSPVVERRTAGELEVDLHRYSEGAVPITVFSADEPLAESGPGPRALPELLKLVDETLERVTPDVVLTYGGNAVGDGIIDAAKRRGIPVVFWLRNCEYKTADIFRNVDGVIVPSQFARLHYKAALGVDAIGIPPPIARARVQVDVVDGRFVTFVNPARAKGVTVVARIIAELERRRAGIPLLVVESRSKVDELRKLGVDYGDAQIGVMENTDDPREFYGVSRMMLVPSLWQETYGRVAFEAAINGIPVLASARGGLPEAHGNGAAGPLLDIPARYTEHTPAVPTAAEVRPWVDAIVRLWNDGAHHDAVSKRARAHTEALSEEKIVGRHEHYLQQVIDRARAGRPRSVVDARKRGRTPPRR